MPSGLQGQQNLIKSLVQNFSTAVLASTRKGINSGARATDGAGSGTGAPTQAPRHHCGRGPRRPRRLALRRVRRRRCCVGGQAVDNAAPVQSPRPVFPSSAPRPAAAAAAAGQQRARPTAATRRPPRPRTPRRRRLRRRRWRRGRRTSLPMTMPNTPRRRSSCRRCSLRSRRRLRCRCGAACLATPREPRRPPALPPRTRLTAHRRPPSPRAQRRPCQRRCPRRLPGDSPLPPPAATGANRAVTEEEYRRPGPPACGRWHCAVAAPRSWAQLRRARCAETAFAPHRAHIVQTYVPVMSVTVDCPVFPRGNLRPVTRVCANIDVSTDQHCYCQDANSHNYKIYNGAGE